MDNNYNNQPDNGQDNTYSGSGDGAGSSQSQPEQQYTDPNAGYSSTDYNGAGGTEGAGSQGQSGYYNQNGQTQYQDQSQYQYQNYNYSQNYNQNGQSYNQNYNQNYNSNYNQNYNQQYGGNGYNPQQYGGMDTSHMSMCDWVLNILALMIHCAGIILYFVLAFGKNGNINRRNYCRAALVIELVIIILSIIVMVIFGAALFTAYPSYGY